MEGKLQKKSPAFHKKWQSRYCALKEKKENEVVLYYFKSQKVSNSSSPPKYGNIKIPNSVGQEVTSRQFADEFSHLDY